jgi:plasmid stabilization system protein ParE
MRQRIQHARWRRRSSILARFGGASIGRAPHVGIRIAGTTAHLFRENAMPQARWSAKRERQYEHIKDSLLERGKGEKTAEEIAARTVNKDRAQHGESKTASRTSLEDISPERRGGLRSHRGEGGRTYAQLYAEAAKANVKGRSRMTKAELERAVGR